MAIAFDSHCPRNGIHRHPRLSLIKSGAAFAAIVIAIIDAPVLDRVLKGIKKVRSDQMVSDPHARDNFASIYSDVLMRLPMEVAEPLLQKHWAQLQESPFFVRAALYQATPQLHQLADAALARLPAPRDVFQYLSTRMGIWLPMLGQAVMAIGCRGDLALLNKEIEGDHDRMRAVRGDAAFAVRRRTLN